MSVRSVVVVLGLLSCVSGSLLADEKPGKNVGGADATKAAAIAKHARELQKSCARQLRIKGELTNAVGGKLVLIPPGEFLMGSSDADVEAALKLANSVKADEGTCKRIQNAERPLHRVTISKPFLLGATEVTIGQFRKFVDATKYVTEAEKYGSANTSGSVKAAAPQKEAFDWRWPGYKQVDDDAVSQVTWNDAVVFCNWLSEQEKLTPCYRPDVKTGWTRQLSGNGYRLPTEAEWEYACRAGTTGQFSFGETLRDLDPHAWYLLKSGSKPVRAVGSKKPNPFGLFDMHGNVFEWCEDGFDATWYAKSPAIDPLAPAGASRVMRGGDWFGNAVRCRSAFRGRGDQTTRSDDVGFRVVRKP